jgi:hypothetical protein
VSDSTLSSITLEAQRMANKISEAGLNVKLLGGLAIWMTCPSAQLSGLARSYGDLDFIAPKKEIRALNEMFINSGYSEDRLFNAIHGATRLIYIDQKNARSVDILVDNFKMCHELELKNRLSTNGPTISGEDILLTKLQIVSINEKDLLDLIALLVDQEFDLDYISILLANNWGFEKTVLQNLVKADKFLETLNIDAPLKGIATRKIQDITGNIERSKKTLSYKLRAIIGEKLPWFEEPEELNH